MASISASDLSSLDDERRWDLPEINNKFGTNAHKPTVLYIVIICDNFSPCPYYVATNLESSDPNGSLISILPFAQGGCRITSFSLWDRLCTLPSWLRVWLSETVSWRRLDQDDLRISSVQWKLVVPVPGVDGGLLQEKFGGNPTTSLLFRSTDTLTWFAACKSHMQIRHGHTWVPFCHSHKKGAGSYFFHFGIVCAPCYLPQLQFQRCTDSCQENFGYSWNVFKTQLKQSLIVSSRRCICRNAVWTDTG